MLRKIFIAILILVILVPIGIYFYIKSNALDIFFYNVEVEGKSFNQTVELLKKNLIKEGLGVVKVLKISKAIRRRGNKDFPNYTVILSCKVKGYEKVLEEVPFMANLLPCSVAIYEKEGKVYVSVLHQRPIIKIFRRELSEESKRLVLKTYNRLIKVINEVAQR